MLKPINDTTPVQNPETSKHRNKSTHGKTLQVQNISEKTKELCTRMLTPEFLAQKTKNFLLAKISPFTSPDEFNAKIKLIKQDLRLIKNFKTDRELKLKLIDQQLDTKISQRQKNALIEQQTDLQKQSLRITEAYKQTKAHLKYLQDINKLQIGGRVSWHISTTTNFVVPGSGVVLGTALTAANALAQEKLASHLSTNEKVITNEKKNVRISTWTTIACTTASIFMGIYIIPTLKSTAWHLWNNSSF